MTFLKEKEIPDGQKVSILNMAKLCKVRNWVDKQTAGEVREFSESDEAVTPDESGE